MLGDKFSINGIPYTIKKELKLGEYRKISGINARLNKLSKNISEDNTSELMEASDEQLQSICDFLESHVGISQEQINELSMSEAISIFQEAFKLSTTPDKELKKT